MGTLVPLPTLWHFNGAGILAPQLLSKKTAILQSAHTDLNIKNKPSVVIRGAKGIEFPQDKCKDPLGRRITEPDEIAAVVLFQPSPESAGFTGRQSFVDGGYVHLD